MMPRVAWNTRIIGLLAAAALTLASPADAQPADAQAFKIGNYTLSGEIEGGARQIYGERRSGRYNEFRDIPQGLFLTDVKLDIDRPGYYYELRALDLLENDQSLRFSLGSPGLYRLDLEWHELQHIFKNQAITPYSGVGGNALTIDPATRALIQGSGAANWVANVNSLFRGGHREVVGFDRDSGEVKFRYQLGPDWNVRANYKNERWDGTKPESFLFGSSPGGRPVIEIPVPIDWRHDQVRLALEWARAGNSLELAYEASLFENRHSSLVFDNPFRSTDAAGTVGAGANAVGGSTRARVALEPDNQAHYISISGAVNLPAQTRLMGTASYGWWLQDDDFIPHTINTALTSPTLALPRRSLDGEINPTLINLVLTNRAIHNLTLTGRYRYYDLENNSKRIEFPGHTVGDTSQVTNAPEENRLLGYTRQNAGLSASYRLSRDLKLHGGYEWRKTKYDEFHAEENQEDRVKVALDWKANNWLMIRPSYIYSDRSVSGYIAQNIPQQAERRLFNLAERERHEGKLMARITPSEKISITIEGGVGTEDYGAKYGVDEGHFWNAAVELVVTPVNWVNFFAAYTHEQVYGKIHSVQNSGSGTPFVDRFLDIDAWTMKFTDDYDVVRVGVEFLLWEDKTKERKLTSRTELTYAYSVGETKNSKDNPASTVVVTENWPDIKSRLWMISTRLDYHLTKNFSVGAGYAYERFEMVDFTQRWVDVVVNPGISTRLYTLGDRFDNYEAHTVAAFVRWRF